ncbi:fumarylacetoacetate hydrolase family protein [Pseudomonas vancouverensis]|uniref:FAA hydrolase family protein n=1 Tax=Pseudomonas vancouverensis TaxID=95300 RepID=A0A1H2NXH5_PSEVA|nr:fumarylacetoacetate hydrolase family protein [Pseudomonas vancouverensis]KAB0496513.1 fumarylacetoacetate hydrolase family protein [Pseudomonas vancouverensis]TDB64779.1 FAA hydrolase family protein [Pseudomonas vancouverensis]SDV10110.1 2-keto-4-pentenoate hydratase/2-oxohepta-3-ene-1,7-dioic acid hydratase (catechol pathway) [Pseudomonas vancouverensis]
MRLARVELAGQAFWALIDAHDERLRRIDAPFAQWAGLGSELEPEALDLVGEWLPMSAARLLVPLETGARVFGVGLNYLSHLQRLGSDAPAHPLAYIKPESALVGAEDEIEYPPLTRQLDYEVELVAVVGRPLGAQPNASDCLLGYTVGNDISARDAGKQIGRLDLLTQKAMDRTTPVGPWIVTADELGIAGQPALDMRLSVNDELRQQDNTRQMIFALDELLNYLDARISLRPGDLVFTGSTHGVGLESGRFLQPGDRIEADIQGIGRLRNTIAPPRQLTPARAVGRLGQPLEN